MFQIGIADPRIALGWLVRWARVRVVGLAWGECLAVLCFCCHVTFVLVVKLIYGGYSNSQGVGQQLGRALVCNSHAASKFA